MEVKDFPQRLKPGSFESSCYGTAEAVPLQNCQILSFSEASKARK
jgi:hypothetical protein